MNALKSSLSSSNTALPTYSKNLSRLHRHQEFVNACKADGLQVLEGTFKRKQLMCQTCGTTWDKHEEKESDVHLGVDLVADALLNRLDVAFVLTLDADIAPAFRLVKQETPVQVVTVIIEPRGHSLELRHLAHFAFYIKRVHLERSLLPKDVLDATGKTCATRPSKYNPPA